MCIRHAHGRADGDCALVDDDGKLIYGPSNVAGHCQHVLQAPAVESVGADGVAVLRTPFFYMETQLDEQLLLAGTVWHHLVPTDAGLRIRLKKVDLVNCEAALPGIQLFP